MPPAAGLFSSFGLLYADVEHHYARSFRRLLRHSDLNEIAAAWDPMAQQARGQLESEGFAGERARLRNVVIDRGVKIPEGLVVGEDPELDGKRFRTTDQGISLITQPMIDKLNA